MDDYPALSGITAAIVVGAISPGPSFVLVARTAAAISRGHALFAALGMGLGGAIFAIAALLGLHAVLKAVPILYTVLKLAGGLYLVYLGLRIWRSADQALEVDIVSRGDAHGYVRSFVISLTTQLSNPKTAIVYASVFAAFLPASPTLMFSLAVVAVVFAIETTWYALVAMVLSGGASRRVYLSGKRWIDRTTGAVMILLGFKLFTSTQES